MERDPTSPCAASYALSAQLAFHYLEMDGISAKYNQDRNLQVGNVVLKRIRSHWGGYQQLDSWGYQIPLNYRSYQRSPLRIVPTVTLKEALNGSLKPGDINNRIVLIGVTAQSSHDYLSTPYETTQELHQKIPGVIAQAQMVSQILSAVEDGRPILSTWPIVGEVLWVWGWAGLGGMLVWYGRSHEVSAQGTLLYLGLAGGSALGVLSILCFGLLIHGQWVPLVPSALALIITSSAGLIHTVSQIQQHQKPSTSRND